MGVLYQITPTSAAAPPVSPVQVFLHSPASGDELQDGAYVPVSLQAVAPQDIASAELFVDRQSLGVVTDAPESAPVLILWQFQAEAAVDKAYCYLSFGDGLWRRLPKQPFDFFGPGGTGYPQQGTSVETKSGPIQAQCWGWQAGALQYLGHGETNFETLQDGQWVLQGPGFLLAGLPQFEFMMGDGVRGRRPLPGDHQPARRLRRRGAAALSGGLAAGPGGRPVGGGRYRHPDAAALGDQPAALLGLDVGDLPAAGRALCV